MDGLYRVVGQFIDRLNACFATQSPRTQTSIDAFCMSASGQFLPHAPAPKKATLCRWHTGESFTDLPIGEL